MEEGSVYTGTPATSTTTTTPYYYYRPITTCQRLSGFILGILQFILLLSYMFLQSITTIMATSGLCYLVKIHTDVLTMTLATIVNVSWLLGGRNDHG